VPDPNSHGDDYEPEYPTTALLFVSLLWISSLVLAGSIPTAKPEEVGLSSERLQRIHEMIQRYMDDGSISGAVTLVARKGRIAHFEAHGSMDLDTKKPISKNSIFRIMSMLKTVAGASCRRRHCTRP
jgi:CubicO group peptidase (beta-lactamase class C family)